jgi:cytochrome P450
MSLPPGPGAPAAVQTARWIARPLPYLDECYRRFGDIFTVRWLGAGAVVKVCAPELVKQVMTADPDVLQAGVANSLLEPMVGKYSLLTLDGAEHLRQRRLLLPAFTGERMQAYAGVMREIAESCFESWPLGEPFALQPLMQGITLDIILRTVFGIADAARFARLREQIVMLVESTSHPIMLLPMLMRLDLVSLLPRSRTSRAKTAVDDMIYEEIAHRRARPTGGNDVLSVMLDARDEDGRAMTDRELRDELVTLLLAGHETTATALAWTFERLLANASALDRLRAELAAGRDDYLDAVIKESLRVRPIVPLIARSVRKPYELAGYTIPAGVRISPSIYLTQRRADIYPDPERFQPERWLGVKPDPYAWLPFGGGIRRCLGMAFALFEMRVVLQAIVPRARLRLADGEARIVRRAITLAPSHGLRVILDERRVKTATAA